MMKERRTGGTSRTRRKTLIVARKVFPTGVVLALQRLMATLATGKGARSRIAITDWNDPKTMIGKSVKFMGGTGRGTNKRPRRAIK